MLYISSSADFSKIYWKTSFTNTTRVSNSFDQNVGPDLGSNCLQRLSADGTSMQRVNLYFYSKQYAASVNTFCFKTMDCEL